MNNKKRGNTFEYPKNLAPNQKALLKAFHLSSFGHSNSVDSIKITSDDKYIISGSADQTIKVWSFETGELIRIFSGHSGMVRMIFITSDNKHLISCAYDKNIIIWNFETGEIIQKIQCEQSDGNEVSFVAAALSPNEKYIVTGVSCESQPDLNSIQIWEFPSGELVHTIRTGEEEPRMIAITLDSHYIIVQCGWDPSIIMWELTTGNYKLMFDDIHSGIEKILVSHDGKHFYTSSSLGTIKKWDIEHGKLLKTTRADDKKITDLVETSDCKHLISCSSGMIPKDRKDFMSKSRLFREGNIKVWDLSSFECILTIEDKEEGDSFSSLDISQDDQYIVTGDSFNKHLIRKWNWRTGEKLLTIKGRSHFKVSSAVLLNDKKTCILSTNQPNIFVFNIETGELIRKFKAHDDFVWKVFLTSDGKWLISISRDHTIKIWEPETLNLLYKLDEYKFFKPLALSKSSKYLACKTYSGIKVIDIKDRKILDVEIYQEDLSSLCFTPEENILTCSYEDHPKIWDKETGNLIRSIKERSKGGTTILSSPDGKYIFSNPKWDKLHMWDFETGDLLAIFEEHDGIIDEMVYSSDMKFLATASSDGQIRVWDFQKMICYGPFKHSNRIHALTFLKDEDIILGGDENSDIKLWEFKKGATTSINLLSNEKKIKSDKIHAEDYKSDDFLRVMDSKFKQKKYEEADVVDYWYHRGWHDSMLYCGNKFGAAFKEFLEEHGLNSPNYYKSFINRLEFISHKQAESFKSKERVIDLGELTKKTPGQDLFEKIGDIFTKYTEKDIPYEDLGKLLGVPELMRSTMSRRDNIIKNLFTLFFDDIKKILERSLNTIQNKDKTIFIKKIIINLLERLKNEIKIWKNDE